jgi:hypothetical protein
MPTKTTFPVTTRALIQRINRVLKKNDQQLKKARGRYEPSIGTYFVIDTYRNYIVDTRIEDIEAYAKELNCIAPYERLVDEDE